MTFVTPLTPAPTPPSIGSPATFPALASAFVAWQAASAAEFNTAIGQINAIDFGIMHATYGGTANAITLTATGVTLSTGLRLQFIPTLANTAATTITLNGAGGAKTVQPLARIGTALPSGYIIANRPVAAVYNGTVWLIDRQTEYITNANGKATRFADGSQVSWADSNLTLVFDSGSRLALAATFAAAFTAHPTVDVFYGEGDFIRSFNKEHLNTESGSASLTNLRARNADVSYVGGDTCLVRYIARGLWF